MRFFTVIKGFHNAIFMLLAAFSQLVLQAETPEKMDTVRTIDTSRVAGSFRIDTFHLVVYPPSSGVQFFKEGIVFLSSKKIEQAVYRSFFSFGALRLYYAPVIDHHTGIHYDFSKGALFSYPAEAASFSKEYTEMYFTRLYKAGHTSIFHASDQAGSGRWVVDSHPLEFCSPGFSYTHPAVSADGNFLIFSSNMTGTKGGMDLYMVHREETSWSQPENLGSGINTQWNEMFPFLDMDNNLYFSSDRQGTLGGYDIFMCRFNGKGWEKPVKPDNLNSEQDDIAFTMSKEGRDMAFFSRRYKTGRKYSVVLLRVMVSPAPETAAEEGKLSSLLYAHASQYTEPEPVKAPEKEVDTLLADKLNTEVKTVKMKPRAGLVQSDINPKKVRDMQNVKLSVSTTDTVSQEKVNEVVKDSVQPVAIVKTPEKENGYKDIIVYRVQILSSSRSKKPYQVTINGVAYLTYEYYYQGAYRTTVGEFTSAEPASELRDQCRKAGYPEAFRVAFRNNKRVGDAGLFK